MTWDLTALLPIQEEGVLRILYLQNVINVCTIK
jgi:hypothetical protein